MKRNIPFLTVLVAAATLSGCGVAYQQERAEILRTASAESFGPPPPKNWQDIAAAFLRTRLKDPDSARFQFGENRRDAIQPAFANPHATPVWVTGVMVNAKNSYGGYPGAQPWALAWKYGRIIAHAPPSVNEYGASPGFWEYLP